MPTKSKAAEGGSEESEMILSIADRFDGRIPTKEENSGVQEWLVQSRGVRLGGDQKG